MNNIREKVESKLFELNINCSTQVINTIVRSIELSASEIVGDSDSILAGLMNCGSYTIDALIDSGVDVKYLRDISSSSASSYGGIDCDPIDEAFSSSSTLGGLLRSFSSSNKTLESADLLEAAISPESLEGSSATWFPKELRKDNPPSSRILLELEDQVCHVIDLCIDVVSKNSIYTLKRRKKSLTNIEKSLIVDELSMYVLEENDIDWAIFLTNTWLCHRCLNLQNSAITLNIIRCVWEDLRYGSNMFLESGGSFSNLGLTLDVAKKYAPERDQPILGLIERDGRVYIKKFSYRNSVGIEGDHQNRILSVNSEAPISLPLHATLSEFEELINKENTKEHEIQKFLEAYPELLQSLGYAQCKSQVILNEEGKKDLIPDFIMQRPGNNGFDILDLKLPTAKITSRTPYLRISYEITKALAQLRAYKNYFNNPVNTSMFYKKYGLDVLLPELIVVIGRRVDLSSFSDRREIYQQAPGLKIITYDELIEYGESRQLVI